MHHGVTRLWASWTVRFGRHDRTAHVDRLGMPVARFDALRAAGVI
jgi:hypothetical protein